MYCNCLEVDNSVFHRLLFSVHISYGKGEYLNQTGFFTKFAKNLFISKLKGFTHRIQLVKLASCCMYLWRFLFCICKMQFCICEMQFCKKKLQQGPRNSQQILLFLQFCIFQRNFCKNFNLFMDQNSETVQQQLKAFSCRLFDGICASF